MSGGSRTSPASPEARPSAVERKPRPIRPTPSLPPSRTLLLPVGSSVTTHYSIRHGFIKDGRIGRLARCQPWRSRRLTFPTRPAGSFWWGKPSEKTNRLLIHCFGQAEQIKLIVLLVLSVPLSLVFPYLPSSTTSIIPDVFAVVPSFWFLWSVLKLRSTTIQLVINTVVCWAIVKFGGKSKWMPWAVFAVAMGHLAVK